MAADLKIQINVLDISEIDSILEQSATNMYFFHSTYYIRTSSDTMDTLLTDPKYKDIIDNCTGIIAPNGNVFLKTRRNNNVPMFYIHTSLQNSEDSTIIEYFRNRMQPFGSVSFYNNFDLSYISANTQRN